MRVTLTLECVIFMLSEMYAQTMRAALTIGRPKVRSSPQCEVVHETCDSSYCAYQTVNSSAAAKLADRLERASSMADTDSMLNAIYPQGSMK